MDVRVAIPDDIAQLLARDVNDVPRAVLEAAAVESVRSGRLTVSQARRLLGVSSRYEMDGILKAHGVLLDVTLDDVRRDSEAALASQP